MPESSGSSLGGGSDPNLTRFMPMSSHISMRRQLLRRIWSKECSRFDRTNSLSPPMRRPSRRMQFDAPASPEVCKECERLEMEYRKSSPELALRNSPVHRIPQRLSLPERPERMDSDDLISAEFSNQLMSSRRDRTAMSTATSVSSHGRAPSDSLDEVVTAPVISKETSQILEKDNVYYVEIDDDQIHITTASTTATGNSNSSGRSVYYSSAHIESINSRSNDENDNTRSVQMLDEPEVKELSTLNRPVAATVSPTTATSITTDVDGGDSNNNPNDNISDNTIDKYISNLLIDSLNNIVPDDKVNGRGQHETQHDSSQMVSAEQLRFATKANSLEEEENRLNTEGITPRYAANNQTVYFPRCASEDSSENMSDYSAKYSNVSDGFELPQDYIITMNSGSNYVENGAQQMVVRRLVDMPRTESLEVQPSSASAPDENPRIDSDDEVSLVDSLDDPIVAAKEQNEMEQGMSPRQSYEKSEAFFVPMAEPVFQVVDDQHQSPRMDTALASSMPEKLREKLEKRQDEMQRRRREEEEQRQYQWSYRSSSEPPKQERRRKTGAAAIKINNQFKPSNMTTESSIDTTITASSSSFVPTTMALKSKERFLRSEIGLLESYTIDSQGNLQFKVQPAAPVAVRSVRKSVSDGTSSRNVVHHTVMKRISSNKPQVKKKEMPKRLPSKVVSRGGQSSSQKTTHPTGASKKQTSLVKDVQQMTLYHQSHSDIVTPDADCGPRRMYQKTEIHDGDKRIEILEIVECLNSSPEGTEASSSAMSSSFTPSLPLKYSKLSRIPVPVASLSATSRNRTKDTSPHKSNRGSGSREATHSAGASQFVKNLQQMGNNSKVDQIIADLLIEALNHSSEFGIEFVKTPNENNAGGDSTSKRTKVARRNVNNSSGKRSACSGKYQRVFDAIPEEKSCLSIDSSNEDRTTGSTATQSKVSTAQSVEKLGSAISTVTTVSSQSNISMGTISSTFPQATTSSTHATDLHASSLLTERLPTERVVGDGAAFDDDSNAKEVPGTSTTIEPSMGTNQSPATLTSTAKSSLSTVSTITNGSGQSSIISSSHNKPATIPSTLESNSQISPLASTSNTVPSKTDETPTPQRSSVPRGRAAIESDHTKTDAWFDSFGRRHTDSPLVDINPPPEEGIVRFLHKTRLFA